MKPEPSSYRHTIRLFLLIAAVLAAVIVLRFLLVPESFGDLGHFRLNAIEEAGKGKLRHVGPEACELCHEDVVTLHAKDAHAGVTCESCHGPGEDHVAAEGEEGILRPDGQGPCLVCHELMLSRPGEFPQIVPEEHYRFVGVEDLETPCRACHDPHEPLYMDRDLRTARLHPLIHRCRDCHAGRFDETMARPENHPPIFQCDYCHSRIAADFSTRPHSQVRCTTCHLFFKESEASGRILRDADPRFCLLCHREADFRSSEAPPGIVWPDHREDMAESENDLQKRCIDCHLDNIHLPDSTAALAPYRSGPEEKEDDR